MEEVLIGLAFIFCLKKKKKRRSYWMRRTLKAREHYSATKYLEDLGIDGCLNDFLRMNSSEFEFLLNLVGKNIAKQDTNWRKSINYTERLAVTLRFLATGCSYGSLGDVFKISHQLISMIIPEVCEALVEGLQEYLHESLGEWERSFSDFAGPPLSGAPSRKWSARTGAHAQDTTNDQTAPVANSTDACKLLIFVGDSKTPVWRLQLCGGNAAAIAARAGPKLLPQKIRIVWNPPTSPYQHTEKLRLVVTAVNSGAICNNDSQFTCGATGLCISSELVCDGVRHCPGGEDEDTGACAHRRDPPLLELLRRFAARNQEFLGLDQSDGMTKPSVIMKITEGEQKSNAFMEFAAALKPYGPWSYLVVGMLVCATILMFCLAWECCCKRSKPSDTPLNIPPQCLDLSPTVTVTAASQQLFTQPLPPSPPEYEPPPSYSSLFPRAFKSSPTPVPHCSHQEPPD